MTTKMELASIIYEPKKGIRHCTHATAEEVAMGWLTGRPDDTHDQHLQSLHTSLHGHEEMVERLRRSGWMVFNNHKGTPKNGWQEWCGTVVHCRSFIAASLHRGLVLKLFFADGIFISAERINAGWTDITAEDTLHLQDTDSSFWEQIG